MEIIVSVDENNGIGKNGELLAHLSPDLKRLKAMTVGNIIVVGRKTYLSFPRRPLPDRENIVLTSRPEQFAEEGDSVKCFSSLNELIDYTQKSEKPVFVLGGAEIYRQLLPYCDKAHITRILSSFDADAFFPDLDRDPEWKKISEGEVTTSEKYPFRYDEYVRVK